MHVTLDRPLYLAEDKVTVVELGDPRAAHILGAKGSTVNSPELERLGLVETGGVVGYPGMEGVPTVEAVEIPVEAVEPPEATEAEEVPKVEAAPSEPVQDTKSARKQAVPVEAVQTSE